MKKFLERGETYSFFSFKNILVGLMSMVVFVLSFFIFGSIEYAINAPVSDIGGEPSLFVIFLGILVFLSPLLFMGKKHGWKSGVSTLVFAILFLTLVVVWLFSGGNKIIGPGI